MCATTLAKAVDYKDTLNLPRTGFPMRAGLPKREHIWLEKWERIGVYDWLRKKEGRTPFILHDGPPYANGHLHIGHALNKILKDMVVRSQQMMGKDARYIPGWDCHGLPIEWKIEEAYRARGYDKDKINVVDFRQECRRFAEGWVDVQREEFKRLGVTGAWDDPYLTMDFHAERVIAEEFMIFLMNGSLYHGSKPVMWSPVERTALAEAEVEYHDRQTDSIWVSFRVVPLSEQMASSDLGNAQVVIWTTTPWTIPQNRAICFGPNISYGLYEVTGRPEECRARIGHIYLIADTLAEDALGAMRLEPSMVRRLRGVTPEELASLTCAHPLRKAEGANGEWDYDVPLFPGDHVTDGAGTGFVHTAPSHGDDDYAIGVKHGLEMTHNILDDSSFRADVPFFGGAQIIKPNGKPGGANKAVVNKLIEVGQLLARRRVTISDAHSWRSKAPVIRLNRPQWFAAIDKDIGGDNTYGRTIRERALRSIDDLVTWTPQTGRNRLYAMIESRPDWVLSRQRAWGVPMTCFVRKNTDPCDEDHLLRDPAVNARVLEAFEAEGADAWYKPGAKARFLGNAYDPDAYEQVFDILDVWFDSGSTHAFVLRDRADGAKDGIADLYLEGTDQHRGWFHSSMLQACGTKGRAPYHGVLTHGFTLDAQGMKMSKSLGNTIAPQKVIEQYGADILRLWVAQADYTADLRVGPEILKGVADIYRRLRNTMRFILGNLAHFTEDDRMDAVDMPELERWVLHRLAELDQQVRTGYAKYDFQGVFQAVFTFATTDLSAFYFDIRKDALYCDRDTLRRRAARTVLDILFHRLTTWLAPILIFTMEEVWLERFPGEESSVHLIDFPDTPGEWRDAPLAAKWDNIRKVRRVVTFALEQDRMVKKIGSSLESSVTILLANSLCGLFDGLDVKELMIVSEARVFSSSSARAMDVPGSTPGFDHLEKDCHFLPEITDSAAVLTGDAEGQKCQRCWKILPDVGRYEHPGVCKRCNEAIGDHFKAA